MREFLKRKRERELMNFCKTIIKLYRILQVESCRWTTKIANTISQESS